MIDTLPNNVELFENSSLYEWFIEKDFINCKFKNNSIKTKKLFLLQMDF